MKIVLVRKFGDQLESAGSLDCASDGVQNQNSTTLALQFQHFQDAPSTKKRSS
jgi:hypothetical protein